MPDDVLVLDALGFPSGASLRCVYARTRSVVPGIAAHVVHVAVSLAARYALGS